MLTSRTTMAFGILLTTLALTLWIGDRVLFLGVIPGLLAKMTASTGILITAIGAGAIYCRYGRVLFIGLVMSWFGDLFLSSHPGNPLFPAGFVAFLLARLAYSIGFARYYIHLKRSLAILVLLIAPGVAVLMWIWPGIYPDLRGSVVLYMIIISIMLAMAATTLGQPGGSLIFSGAFLLYVSDIFMARGQFVTSDFYNMAVGLPLYFGGQLLLASSIAIACRDARTIHDSDSAA